MSHVTEGQCVFAYLYHVSCNVVNVLAEIRVHTVDQIKHDKLRK